MMNKTIKYLATCALLLAMSLVPVRAVHAGETCYDDWSAAASAVKAYSLVPVARLGTLARQHADGQLVRTELCKRSEGYVYKVIIRDNRGGLKRLVVNAKTPFAAAPVDR